MHLSMNYFSNVDLRDYVISVDCVSNHGAIVFNTDIATASGVYSALVVLFIIPFCLKYRSAGLRRFHSIYQG